MQLIVFNLQDICILFEVTLNLIMGYYIFLTIYIMFYIKNYVRDEAECNEEGNLLWFS